MEKVGILAVQGAFIEHEHCLEALGAQVVQLREAADLHSGFNRLVLPGGESTVQSKLLIELGMADRLREMITAGMPVLGTCAGLILLAKRIMGKRSVDRTALGTLDVTVERNAYGRQLGSFNTRADFAGMEDLPMTFIRAPRISEVGPGVEELGRVNGLIVGARAANQIGVTFHPELTGDPRLHQMFLNL
ncbi:pyridoxal 5'-phosphate synthase glutaminase subunit PdxT [uncultured Varibaculum sp.]|uniref:pyridoxal 5'-phosphate synthase glutaminase subunit PdxT n=1 Tax=uncultured Varibaculum sp. TaxID=413896 RepID=UPI002594FA71|nr:pyridoxal 5'-phosphate synthase glutaminase subunit PdxT [uncultured Varibaculum sp.]